MRFSSRQDDLATPWGDDLGRRAHDELSRLLHAEIATLLEHAADLRASMGPFAVLVPELGRGISTRSAWRAEALATLAELPFSDAGSELVGRLCRAGAWPRASRLAEEAVRQDETEGRRLALGRALLAEGSASAARRIFQGLLVRDPAPDLGCRALAGLAFAHLSEGNDRLALGAMDCASGMPEADLDLVLESLLLGLLVGDPERACRASTRLRRRRPGAGDLAQGLALVTQRISFLRGGLQLAPAPRTNAVALQLVRDDEPGACVAQLLIGAQR